MTKREKIIILLKSTSSNRETEADFKDLIRNLPVDRMPKLKKIQEKYMSRFDELCEQTFNGQVDLYDELLSEEAIDASNLFYSSIEGQEVVSKLPKLNAGLSRLSLDFTAKLAKELITDLLKLAPTEEEMTMMGFTKISSDMAEIFGEDIDEDDDDDDEDDVDKVDVDDDDDDDGDYEQFLKDYKI